MGKGIWQMTGTKPANVVLYAHGSCINNGSDDAVAGCAYYFRPNNPYNLKAGITGFQEGNRAQILSIYFGLKYLCDNTDFYYVEVRTNSDYARSAVCDWFDDWEENGWVKSNGDPVANREDIVLLYDIGCEFKNVTYSRVSKNDDDPYFDEVCQMSLEAAYDKYDRLYPHTSW